jgi:hypothetical protein
VGNKDTLPASNAPDFSQLRRFIKDAMRVKFMGSN